MDLKAVVKATPEPGASYMDLEVPEIRDDEVLIRVLATAICGTDNHIYEWNDWAARTFASAYGPLPRVLGHEFVGDIVTVGSDVKGLTAGDRVAGEPHVPCGECLQCRVGQAHICGNLKRPRTGCFAQYAVLPARCAVKVAKELPLEVAAVFEPAGCALHAVDKLGVGGNTFAVTGCGPIGLFAVAAAKTMGAALIVATDVSPARLAVAARMGATVTINPATDDPVQAVLDLTGGWGVDCAVESSGNVGAAKQLFKMLRKGGRISIVGLTSEPLPLDVERDIAWKGVTIYGIHGREIYATWVKTSNLLLAGRLDVAPALTHRFSLAEYEQAFAASCSGQAGKVILLPEQRDT